MAGYDRNPPQVWAFTKTKVEDKEFLSTITRKEGYEEFKIELRDAEDIILKAIKANGFTVEKTNRQKYPRIKINS
mgnify:CR=1 FL=1